MIKYYTIDEKGIRESDSTEADWISLVDLSDRERQEFSHEMEIAEINFVLDEYYFTPSEFKELITVKHSKYLFLELNHLPKDKGRSVEERLDKVNLLMSNEHLITVSSGTDAFFYKLFEAVNGPFNPYGYAGEYLLHLQNCYIDELHQRKMDMDHIHSQARSSMKSGILEELTNVEQDFLYLYHVITNEEMVLKAWLAEVKNEKEQFSSKLAYTIEVKMNTVQTMVKLYRELQEATSDLISSMMDNRLNNIMEQLTSLSILIAIPTLVFSLFGINTGGLWGLNSPLGSLAVVIFSIILSISTYYFLKKKDYLE